ncbi:MAG: hypothetical protein ACYSYU_11715, partial [Planctomycetota bacterium]
IIDDADEATFKATVNLEIGTDVQAWSAVLDTVTASTYAGDNAIVTVGTIGTGVWQGTAINGTYIDISGTTAEAATEDADLILIYDNSAALVRSQTKGNFKTGIGAGSPVKFDIGDDGGDDSIDIVEIATTGDTNTIFTEPSPDKILIAVGNKWPTSDLADTVVVVDSTDATSFIAMFDSATGSLAAKTDGGLTYNATTGVLTATGFAGPITGDVTGTADLANTVLVVDSTDATSFIAMCSTLRPGLLWLLKPMEA